MEDFKLWNIAKTIDDELRRREAYINHLEKTNSAWAEENAKMQQKIDKLEKELKTYQEAV